MKSTVNKGSNWENKQTGKKVIVLNQPFYIFDDIQLLHESGRVTHKKQHYFLHEFNMIGEPNAQKR